MPRWTRCATPPATCRGGTAVVTLEPCNHTGRTGPCTRALIDAGIARVVYAQSDPNPVASGRGARHWRPRASTSRAVCSSRRRVP